MLAQVYGVFHIDYMQSAEQRLTRRINVQCLSGRVRNINALRAVVYLLVLRNELFISEKDCWDSLMPVNQGLMESSLFFAVSHDEWVLTEVVRTVQWSEDIWAALNSYGLESRCMVTDVCMEWFRNARAREMGDPQESPGQRHRQTRVTTLPFKDSVGSRALERADAWGEIVQARVVSVADLVAAEAKYHKQCRLLFASTGSASSILHDKWYSCKKNTEKEENIRFVEAAPDIIRRNIRSPVFDTKIYPVMESLDSGQLPEKLKTFLNRVIQGEVVERKNTVIGEAIMSACHPRSYISPTLLGIGVYIHRHHESRQLIDILRVFHYLQATRRFKDKALYEFLAVEHDRANTSGSTKGYIQYAFDNSYFNTSTLTGHGTFHSMDGVRFITPAQNQQSMTVNRLLHPPSADTIAVRGKFQVNCYKKSELSGLKGIHIRELYTVCDATAWSVKNAIAVYVLWFSAGWLNESSAPSWNFEECKHHNQDSCIVTFDQSLYAKLSEIIAAEPPGELDSVTLRLGGVHILVSFMGSIGFIMSGSGIEELAVRAHVLTSQALITMILRMENLFGVYQEVLHELFLEVSTGEKIIPDAIESLLLVSFSTSFERKCTALSEESRTGKLWVQYLRQMEKLPSRMPPHEYDKFKSEGFFTVQRKNEFWGRVWADLSIDQYLMRTLKTKGVLTRGRGITENTLLYFVAASPICLKLCNALEELSGIKAGSSEQHVELRDSRRTRDSRDDAVLLSWFKDTHLGMLTACNHLHLVLSTMMTENYLKHYISYELSPRPPPVFDEEAMGNTVKSAVLQLFSYTTAQENSTNHPRRIVIDDGHLLHALVWPHPATYGQIADSFLEFVQEHYRVSVTVVFDGYNVQSTKSQEHFRRASKRISAEIMSDMNTSANTTQVDFLSNHHNKERLITLLSHHFETVGIEVCKGRCRYSDFVASDTDIAVVLLARATDAMELRVLSPGTNTKCDKVNNVRGIQKLSGRSKEVSFSVVQLLVVTHLLSLAKYTRSIAKQPVVAAFELATLTPSAACAEHSLRAYCQHLSLCCTWFPVDVRQTVATEVNAGVLYWPAQQCVDIVEKEVA
ncbi:hypothetical protein PR048_011391 [Dryococelus australis]|uniref:Uncharacterized protein n=1 Tax=Dryococelus australis TaxID=614101 RepID=A0ABQ9HLE8_9NEOP|nr:hypothetical protein PR048_011391 [Dryococelus australis]